jgi:replicative DNA helicase
MRNASDYQLEESVIGCVLMDPRNLALLPSLASIEFMHAKSRATWDAIRNLESIGSPIDVTTIGDELARIGKLDAVGWSFLGECALCVPTVDNAIEYARRVKDRYLRRRVMESLAEIMTAAKDGALSGAELLSMTLAGVSVLDSESPDEARTIGEVIRRRILQLDEIARERATGQRSLSGVPTGIPELDERISGWQRGIVSIVAARPGMGKSSLSLATADACSARGIGCHVFSLEDTESAYADRTLSRESRVPAQTIRNTGLNATEQTDVARAYRELRARQGWLFDDRSGITAAEIVRSVRRHRRDNATQVVIIDYVQLVKPAHRGREITTHEALTEIIQTLADAAKQDNLAYVVMSQLNRAIESRTDRRPQLSDLRESGSLEERAKCVVGMYRGAAYTNAEPVEGIDYDQGSAEPTRGEFERMCQLLVLKNSNGRTGTVRATWMGPTMRLE